MHKPDMLIKPKNNTENIITNEISFLNEIISVSVNKTTTDVFVVVVLR